jgi:hypothetical protein
MWTDGMLHWDTPDELLTRVTTDDWGRVAASLYDTARLVALAPFLPGHPARIDYLCQRQNPDGSWSGPDGYELVPTMSATGALLAELDRNPGPTAGPVPRVRLASAGARGLAALRRWLDPRSTAAIPDTIGVELIVPALLDELAQLLARRLLANRLDRHTTALRLPAGFDRRPLELARTRLAAGDLPQRAWVCLELLGPAAAGAPSVRPAGGAVGCSAAATAAWLGAADGPRQALTFLDRLQRRTGGPVAGVTPITYFESAWVLNSLSAGGLQPAVPPAILDRLEAGLSAHGAPAAPGLPVDSDDTAAVLSALLRHGRRHSMDRLLDFRADGYFRCFLDERNPSVSANAHVLEALALYLRHRPADRSRLAAPASMVAGWLLAQQWPDGSWQDKWHASPYYATACCVLALRLHGGGVRPGGARVRAAIARAVRWVRATQRPDGSWGRWQGTVEESAYAVQTLVHAAEPEATRPAITLGRRFLATAPPAEPAPLWHAKDLYTPIAVVQAARLAALGPSPGPAGRPATARRAETSDGSAAVAPAPAGVRSRPAREAVAGTG